MLKKQTVWLLTMLSLMIVLSVYYVMSPNNEDLAYVENGQTNEEDSTIDSSEVESASGTAVVEEVSNTGKDELFTTIRMEVEDDRSMQIERLEDIVASGTASVEEKDKALKDIDNLENISKKEVILEESILSSAEYEDVLVRTEDDKVHVHVKASEITDTEVVNIMQMVRDEFGEITVDVNIQPIDKESSDDETEQESDQE